MKNPPQATDLFQEQRPQGYGMLKTLTILTFIGCAIAYIFLILEIASWNDYERQLAEAQEIEARMAGNEVASRFTQGSVEMIQKSHEHRYLLAAATFLFTTMCLIGAMRMRRLKKSGYPIYVIGELAPLIISAVLLGFGFLGGIVMAVSLVFALMFVILYTTQRKYMVYN